MPELKPKDVVAIIVIIGLFILRGAGVEFMIPAAIYMILGYYFAKRTDKKDSGE